MTFIFLTPEQIEAARARHDMLQADAENRVRRLFDEQTPENLATLAALFLQCSTDKRIAAHHAGFVEALMVTKFADYCKDCGEKHDEAPAADTKLSAAETEAEAFNGVPERWTQPSFDDVVEAPDPVVNFVAQLKEYEVELVNLDDPLGKVKCLHCRTVFPSLEDRMRRDPGKLGCGVCLHKEKWG